MPDLVALKFVLIPLGVLSVMTTGITMMLVWCANNLDTLHMVGVSNYHGTQYHLSVLEYLHAIGIIRFLIIIIDYRCDCYSQ